MKIVVRDVLDCLGLLRYLKIKYREDYISDTSEVTYGAFWQGDTLIVQYDSYIQSRKNVVKAVLRRLKEKGIIKNYEIEQYRTCFSDTCRHITHDEYTLDYAEVEL